jgi:2-amino-4-hydroxy-6-hydroxymethyldihydropteridine diphosphokinase
MLAIEKEFGRERKERWGPRSIDLDLLYYGDLIIAEADLTIPHPRIAERKFILTPLAEIAPLCVDPVSGLTANAMLLACEDNSQVNRSV